MSIMDLKGDELLNFCFVGDIKAINNLLNEGVSANFQDEEGTSPLQISSANGYIDIASLLLENGADVDLGNIYGWTPLMHAARHGQTAIVSLLLKNKAKVNITNKLGLRPLVAASWSGQLSCVKLLLEAGALVDHMPSSNEENSLCDLSSLMAAALQGHDSLLRFLLENEASINQASSITGLTSLMLAACNGHKQIAQILVEWGGDPNLTNICGRNALDIAIARSKLEVKAYLESITLATFQTKQSLDVDILQSIRNGDLPKVKLLCQKCTNNANIHDPNEDCTPLMLAAKLGHTDIIELLLASGANLNFQDKENGWTALMYAVFYRQENAVQMLVEKGANINICTLNGYTALDLARHIDNSQTKIIDCLTSKLEIKSPSSLKFSSTLTPSKKLSTYEKSPKKSEQQIRFKGWIGGVTQHLQQKIFSRQTSKVSDTNLTTPNIYILDETNDDVFGQTLSPEKTKLSISAFLSPNKHLSDALRKQSFEAITPPLLSSPNEMNFLKKHLPKSPSCKKVSKKIVSLQPSKLLSKPSKNYSTGTSINETKNGSLSSYGQKNKLDRINYQDHNSEFREQYTHVKPEISENLESIPGDLTQLLNQNSLQKHAQKFRDEEVDLEAFQCLTAKDLSEIGIKSFTSRQKLLEIIKQLQNET